MSSERNPLIVGRILQFSTILYMLVIFYSSHQSSISQPGPLANVPSIDKLEHMCEFLLLCILMYGSFYYSGNDQWRTKAWMLAILGTILYAMTDEIHQLFIPGREVSLIDLLADSTGAAVAGFIGAYHSEKNIQVKRTALRTRSKKAKWVPIKPDAEE